MTISVTTDGIKNRCGQRQSSPWGMFTVFVSGSDVAESIVNLEVESSEGVLPTSWPFSDGSRGAPQPRPHPSR